jgi:PAS domain S-box-containing protein
MYVYLTGIASKKSEQCFITMVDITELMHASQTLLLYSEILQNMVEGVFLVRACDHVIVYTNPAIEKIFGYAPLELVGREISTVNAPTDKSPEEVAREIIQDLKNTGSWQGEVKNLRKDGTTFWSYANVSSFNDPLYGNVWISIHMDISERKLAHEILLQSEKNLQTKVKQRTRELDNLNKALKTELVKRKSSQNQLKESIRNMKKLNTYLLKVREEERINIARIIHDDLAQLLTSLKIELTSHKRITDKLKSMEHDSIDSMLLLVDECMVSVTSVITELRPVILDNMGLIPALKQLFSDFQRHVGISCDIRILEDFPPIKDELATAIYRVVEEGLINIRNHSKASYVTVKISGNPSSFSIILKDNGRGITREESSDYKSFGIIGMKERIATLGGKITFTGIHGKGTTIKLKVPVSSNKNSLSTLSQYV